MATILINTQPAPVGDLLTPYAPVAYIIEATTAYGNAPIVKAQVVINGAAYKSAYAQPHFSLIGGVYYFSFDVAEILRSYLSNTDTFNLGGNTNTMPAADVANAGFAKKCEFSVDFEVWEPSGTNGIYVASGVTDSSNTLYALNIAANQFLDEGEIANYGAILPFKFLSSAPIKQVVQTGSKAYLSFFDTGATRRGIEVKTYNSAGVLQATNYIDIGQALNTVKRVRRIAVGAADIALITSLTGIFYYTITVVDDITLSTPNAISETRIFYINNNCYTYTLYFLNQFGADDYIGFKDYIQTQSTAKQNYLANVDAYPTQAARGQTTLNSTGQQRIILQKESVAQSLMSYVYEAQNTIEAYLIKQGTNNYIAAVIEDVREVEAVGTDTRRRNIEISCLLANQEYSHQN